jgi:hypothetical protein
MKIGDLVSDILTGLRGIIVETLVPEDMWLVLYHTGIVNFTVVKAWR